MAHQKISRNDPCPCRSGKKYKHCCYGKDIDWSARPATAIRPVLPRMVSKPSSFSFGQFGVVDTKLKAIARTHPEAGEWKGLIERLSDTTTGEDRLKAYKALREANVIPDEAGEFLISWAIQWMPPESGRSAPTEPEDDFDEEAASQELDKETLAQLRKFGMNDLAEMFVSNRLEFDRRHERGRQFFYGPPDEVLATSLRAKGVID
jgi:hypothetical protein